MTPQPAAFAAACTDGPGTEPGAEGQLVIRANVTPGTSVLVVDVTAADIPVPLVFNLGVMNGVVSGSIVVSAGSDRLVTVRAFSFDGVETHSGRDRGR